MKYSLSILSFLLGLIISIIIYYLFVFSQNDRKKIQSWSKSYLLVNFNGKDVPCTVYCFRVNGVDEWALVYGNPQLDDHPMVRIQSQCITGIELDDSECDCKQNLKFSKEMLINNPNGGVLYLLNQDGKRHGGVLKLKELDLRSKGVEQKEIIDGLHDGKWDARSYEFILETLNIIGLKNSIRLISRFPEKVSDLEVDGVNIVEVIPYKYYVTKNNHKYLKMKQEHGYEFDIK
jgi:GTP cyclohydrolase II